jgi:hypothetical protein
LNFQPENVFIDVGIEKDQILNAARDSRAELVVKTLEPSSEISLLQVEGFKNQQLICSPKKITFLASSGQLIVQIFIGAEKYYSLMSYEKKLDSYYLDGSGKMFHLQRREDFRLKIPASFHAFAKLNTIDGAPHKSRVALLDFSGGGCRLEIQNGLLSLNSEIELEMHLQGRSPIPIKGIARHLAPHPDLPVTEWAGVQFLDLSEPVKNKIIAVKLDIYRELFSKLK